MSQFEFFMVFYGLLLGLGVAELLGGFANILREQTRPKLGMLTPLLGLIVLTEMMANFIDAWAKFQDIRISLPGLGVPMLIGLSYFLVAVILLPRHFSDWPSLDDYFARRRNWIVGLLIGANLLIISLEVTRLNRTMTGGPQANLWSFLAGNIWLLSSYLVLLLSRRRWLSVVAAVSVLAFYVYFYGFVGIIERAPRLAPSA